MWQLIILEDYIFVWIIKRFDNSFILIDIIVLTQSLLGDFFLPFVGKVNMPCRLENTSTLKHKFSYDIFNKNI